MRIQNTAVAVFAWSVVLVAANAAQINSTDILPAKDPPNNTTGWRVSWSDPGISIDWTNNANYEPGSTVASKRQGDMQLSLDFASGISPADPADLVKTLHFEDATPNTVESTFGLRFNMTLNVTNDTQDQWHSFAMAIYTRDNLASEGTDGGHPWQAHFHPQSFNGGPFTINAPLNSTNSGWANPSFYANMIGTLDGQGGTATIKGIGVHDYESSTATPRKFDLVFIGDGSIVPEPGTWGLAGTAMIALLFRLSLRKR